MLRVLVQIALLTATLAVPGTASAQTEVLRTFMLDHEIILFDDGTWAFDAPGVSLSDPIAEDSCLTFVELSATVCNLLDLWQQTHGIEEPSLRTWTFVDPDVQGLSLSISVESWGHGGDQAYLDGLDSEGFGFLQRLIAGVAGVGSKEYQTFLANGSIIFDESYFAEASFGDYTLNLTGPTHNFFASLSYFPSYHATLSVDDIEALLTASGSELLAGITMNNQPITDIFTAHGETPLVGFGSE